MTRIFATSRCVNTTVRGEYEYIFVYAPTRPVRPHCYTYRCYKPTWLHIPHIPVPAQDCFLSATMEPGNRTGIQQCTVPPSGRMHETSPTEDARTAHMQP